MLVRCWREKLRKFQNLVERMFEAHLTHELSHVMSSWSSVKCDGQFCKGRFIR